MTISEAISQVDELKPNDYSMEQKIKWLNRLDTAIKTEIIDTRDGADQVEFNGYTAETPPDTELLVPPPYDDIYIYWLQAQIDYFNGEISKYTNDIAMYNNQYSAFQRYYFRNHKSASKQFKYF